MATMVPYSRFNTLNDWFNAMSELACTDAPNRTDAVPASFMMDVQENPENYVVEATVPGVAREEIDVELNEGRLNVTVDKRDSEEVAHRNYVHRETTAYRAVRSVYLKDADNQGLTATLKDGVLTVNVPKRTHNGNVTKVLIG
jgi:HSP20 family protein